jgi:hypothetical protein
MKKYFLTISILILFQLSLYLPVSYAARGICDEPCVAAYACGYYRDLYYSQNEPAFDIAITTSNIPLLDPFCEFETGFNFPSGDAEVIGRTQEPSDKIVTKKSMLVTDSNSDKNNKHESNKSDSEEKSKIVISSQDKKQKLDK